MILSPYFRLLVYSEKMPEMYFAGHTIQLGYITNLLTRDNRIWFCFYGNSLGFDIIIRDEV